MAKPQQRRKVAKNGVIRSDARPLLGLVLGGGYLALDESVDSIEMPLVVNGSPNTSFALSPQIAGFPGGVSPLRGAQLAYVDSLIASPSDGAVGATHDEALLAFEDFLATPTSGLSFPLLASSSLGLGQEAQIAEGSSTLPTEASSGGATEVPSSESDADSSEEPTVAESEDEAQGECVTDTGDEDCVAISEQSEDLESSGLGSLGAAGGGLPLASFGGGGSGFAAGGSSVSTSVSGAVIDGYVEDSTVFADLNGDGIWNTGEPTAITDASGAYTLEAAGYDLSQYTIIATGGTDVTTGATVDVLIAPAGVSYVTPISAIAYYAEEAGVDSATVLAGLGFSYDDMLVDPAAAESYNEDFLVAGASILTAVSSSASLLAEASGESAADVSASIFAQLAVQDTADLKLLTDRTDADSDPASFLESVLTSTVAARGMTVDASVLTSASQSIGSVVKELRTADTLSDVQVAASIGQALLKDDLKIVGEAIRNGDSDITTLMDGIRSNYQDSFATLKVAQESALKGRNSGIDGLTVNKDILGITLAETGEVDAFTLPDGTVVSTTLIKDRAVFESSDQVTHVLLENDSIDASLTASLYEPVSGTILTPVNSTSSEGIVITPTTSGLGFEVAFDPAFFAFDLTEADFAGSVDPVGDLLVLLNAATAKYGDYYFEYQVAVEGEATQATGLVTLQITPDVDLDLKDTFTASEDQPIMLADLLNSRTFGPGDQMVLDGLPVGTIVSLPMVADPINGDETLSYTASGTAPVTIPTEWMLPWRFDDITITLPEHFSGQVDLKASLVAQYESATARDKDATTITVDAVADGVTATNSAELGALAQELIGTDGVFEVGETRGLFDDVSGLIDQIRAAITDDSEVGAVAIGLQSGAVLSNLSAISDPEIKGLDDRYSWFVFDDRSRDLDTQLDTLMIEVTDNALTDVLVNIAFGSVEIDKLESENFGLVTSIAAGTAVPAAVPLVFAEATADTTDSVTTVLSLTSNTDDFSIDVSEIIPLELQEVGLPDDQLVTIEVTFPKYSGTSGYSVLPESTSHWQYVSSNGGDVTYALTGVTVASLYDGSLAALTLRPAPDYFSPATGDEIRFSAETFTEARPTKVLAVESADGQNTAATVSITVPPSIDVGLVGKQASTIRLTETQGDADNNWVSLNQFLALDASSISSVADSTTTLHLEFTDTTALGASPVEIQSGGVNLTPTVESDVYSFTVDLDDVSTLDGIQIRGAPYLDVASGEVGASFHLSVTVDGYDPQVGESTTIKTLIEAQASGVDPSVVAATGYQATEDTAFALQDLIDSAAVIKDTDGSEILNYVFRLPTDVYLQASGPMMGGRVDNGERVFEIAASDVSLYSVVPADSFAADGLSFSITPVTVDANGDRLAGNLVEGSFDIAGVSEAPTLAVTSGVSGLIDGATTELAVPVVVVRTDTDETVSVTLTLSAPQGVNGDNITLAVEGTPLTLTNGSVTLTDMALIKKLSTLTVTSTDDYRDSNALSLTVTASSQDGSDTPAVVSETTLIEIYQPVQWLDEQGNEQPANYQAVTLSKVSGSQSLTLTVEMPTQPDTLGPADVALLVTGVTGDTYFSDGGTPIGASLGGGVWLFTGAEVFGADASPDSSGSLESSIQVNGTDLFTPAVKAIFTDAVGGTSATSGQGTYTAFDPLDPVVIAFDAAPGLMDMTSSPVAFDFVEQSLVGLEEAPYWFTGSYAEGTGTPAGTAFVVQGDTVTTYNDDTVICYNDLYPSLDALIADPDLANAWLWFDSDTVGTLGIVDAGELIAASEVLDLTALVAGDISPIDLDYDTQFTTAITTDVTVVDSVSLTYGTDQSATAYGMVLPYDSDASPEATLTVASPVDEDAPIQVGVTFTPIDPIPPGTIVNLVKIYGVPENAMLSGAVRVEDEFGSTDYWIATIADGSQTTTTSLALKFNTQHETTDFSLSVQPLVSVTDATDPLNPVIETVFGRTSADQLVTITARAETDLMIGRDSEGALSVLEGTAINPADVLFSEIGLSVSSPDASEDQSVALTLTRDDGTVITDLTTVTSPVTAPYLVTLDGTAYANGEWLDNNGTAVFAIPEADLATVALRLPELSTDAYTLSFYPISEHDGDFAFDSDNVLEVPITVQAVAQGAENPAQQFEDDQGVAATLFTEGDIVQLQLAATRIDVTETLVFRVTVTDPGATDFTKLTTIGGVAPTTIDGNQATYEFAFAADETIPAMEMVMDANFSGTLEISTEVATIDPVSGDQIAFGSPVDSALILEGNPGNNGDSYEIAIRQNDTAISQLEAIEGQDLTFTVRVTSFDPDETFGLSNSLPNQDIKITGPTVASTNASGVDVYDFAVTYTGVPEIRVLDGLQLTISEGSVPPVTTVLNPIPMFVDPSTQGVDFSVGPPVLSGSESEQTDAVTEGQVAYLHTNARAFDSSENLRYKVKLSGNPDLETGLTSIGSIVLTAENRRDYWDSDSQYFEFAFDDSDSTFSDPIELRFDQYFSGEFNIEVGVGAFEPRAEVPIEDNPTAFSGYKTHAKIGEEHIDYNVKPDLAEVPVSVTGDPGNLLGVTSREVVFDLGTELPPDQFLDIDKILIGGSRYELGLFQGSAINSSDSIDGLYKEFDYDADDDGVGVLQSLTVEYEPHFEGNVHLKVLTKDGNIIDVTSQSIDSIGSFSFEYRQNGSSVNSLKIGDDGTLQFVLRITQIDPNETVALLGNYLSYSSRDDSVPGQIEYAFLLTESQLSGVVANGIVDLRGLSIQVSEHDNSKLFDVPPIGLRQHEDYHLGQSANGFEDVALADALPLDGLFSPVNAQILRYELSSNDDTILGEDLIIKDENGFEIETVGRPDGTTAYHLTRSQVNHATITLAAAASLFSNNAAAELSLLWNAIATDGTDLQAGGVTIDLSPSDQFNLNNGNPIFVVEGQTVDIPFEWQASSAGDFGTIYVSGIQNPGVFSEIQSHVLTYQAPLGYLPVTDDTSSIADESALITYRPTDGIEFLNEKALLTAADVIVLPDVNAWSVPTDAKDEALGELFGDGYFREMLAGNEFVFIDDNFGGYESNDDGTAVEKNGLGFGVDSSNPIIDIMPVSNGGNLVNIFGTDADDLIVSNTPDGAMLFGAAGRNEIIGNIGNDHLIAGAGLDLLRGNQGDDVYQIAVDVNDSEDASGQRMDDMLSALFGRSEIASFNLQLTADMEGKDLLSESENAFFSAFVDGYSFKTDNSSQDDSDYLVFSSGSDKSIQLEYHAFQHTWGASGETDSFVYALAREFEDPSTESPDDYTSVLVRLASNDLSYVDQINDGTLDIGIITAG